MAKKLQYAITYFFIGIVILACALGLFSCNTPEKLQRQSDKHFFKALAKDKVNVHGRCSDIAPPIVMTRDSFIYKPGKPILLPGRVDTIEIDCDSVVRNAKKDGISANNSTKVKIPVKAADTLAQVDTTYKSSNNTAVDNNKVKYLEGVIADKDKQITALQIELAKKQKALSIVLWGLIFVTSYTLLRWLLRYFTKGRINIP